MELVIPETRSLHIPSLAKMAKALRVGSDRVMLELAERSGLVKRRSGIHVGAKAGGIFALELIGPDGRPKDLRIDHNLVVDAGLNWIREYGFDSVTPTTKARMSHIGIGTGTNAATSADTDLQTPSVRQAFTASTGYAAGGTGVVTVLTTFAAGTGTGAITEACVVNHATSPNGQMWNRAVFAAVNKGAGDTLKVTVTVTFTAN